MSPHKLLSKPKIRIRKKGGPRSHQTHDTHTHVDLQRELHLGKLVFKASTKSDFSFHLGAGQRETQPTFGEMVAGPWKVQHHVILFKIPQLNPCRFRDSGCSGLSGCKVIGASVQTLQCEILVVLYKKIHSLVYVSAKSFILRPISSCIV